jgi:uncharacterized DUF497 family protein
VWVFQHAVQQPPEGMGTGLIPGSSTVLSERCYIQPINWLRNKCIDNINTFFYFERMDESYKLNGINFIWDRDKARKNFGKHRILFENAAEAFFDPFIRVVDASVVHIVVEHERIRIISARKATRLERRFYEN